MSSIYEMEISIQYSISAHECSDKYQKMINVTVFYSSVTNTRKLHLGLFRKLPYTEKKGGNVT